MAASGGAASMGTSTTPGSSAGPTPRGSPTADMVTVDFLNADGKQVFSKKLDLGAHAEHQDVYTLIALLNDTQSVPVADYHRFLNKEGKEVLTVSPGDFLYCKYTESTAEYELSKMVLTLLQEEGNVEVEEEELSLLFSYRFHMPLVDAAVSLGIVPEVGGAGAVRGGCSLLATVFDELVVREGLLCRKVVGGSLGKTVIGVGEKAKALSEDGMSEEGGEELRRGKGVELRGSAERELGGGPISSPFRVPTRDEDEVITEPAGGRTPSGEVEKGITPRERGVAPVEGIEIAPANPFREFVPGARMHGASQGCAPHQHTSHQHAPHAAQQHLAGQFLPPRPPVAEHHYHRAESPHDVYAGPLQHADHAYMHHPHVVVPPHVVPHDLAVAVHLPPAVTYPPVFLPATPIQE